MELGPMRETKYHPEDRAVPLHSRRSPCQKYQTPFSDRCTHRRRSQPIIYVWEIPILSPSDFQTVCRRQIDGLEF